MERAKSALSDFMSKNRPTPNSAADAFVPRGASSSSDILSPITFIALGVVLTILVSAFFAARALLPARSSTKIHIFFIWHAFDALVHFALEGSFLYHCFFSSAPVPSVTQLSTVSYFPWPMTPHGTSFLGDPTRLHGTFYSDNFMAKLWQDYARADRRWGGADLSIVSLELLTVFIMAPLAVYICYLLSKGMTARAYFWMVFVATSELYGGFITFAPEWLTGSPNLDTSNFMFLWVYLIFFNVGLWVVLPVWVLWESYKEISAAFDTQAVARIGKKSQ